MSDLVDVGAAATEVVFAGLPLEKVTSLFPEHQPRQVGSSVSLLVPKGISVDEILRRGLESGASVESVQSQRRPMEDIFIEEIATRDVADDAPRACLL